jgi:hypothetical protein
MMISKATNTLLMLTSLFFRLISFFAHAIPHIPMSDENSMSTMHAAFMMNV